MTYNKGAYMNVSIYIRKYACMQYVCIYVCSKYEKKYIYFETKPAFLENYKRNSRQYKQANTRCASRLTK